MEKHFARMEKLSCTFEVQHFDDGRFVLLNAFDDVDKAAEFFFQCRQVFGKNHVRILQHETWIPIMPQ